MTLRFGRYETIEPIARGGMATVYVGRAVGAGGFERRVAIKVMHEHISEDPEFHTMFLDEARLAARIHHPNVVSTIDVQKTDDAMFLVMEFIDGASLKDIQRALRQKERRMPVGMALRIMIDALSGLHAAHELKGKDGHVLQLVHRDVSPHNILVGSDGVSRITDFGVARAEARLTTTRGGRLKGKLAYMPPEQGRGDEIDRRADVYAAGVCLWEILTGRRLFKAEHDGELVLKVLEGAQESPKAHVPELPDAIDAACMKALAVVPEHRYATAADFADGLEDAAHEAGLKLPSTRGLARFVEEFRIRVKSLPPPTSDIADEVSRDAVSQPTSPTRPGVLDEATVQEVSETQLTGIGDTTAASARPKSNQTLMAAAAAALVVAGGAIAIAMMKDRPTAASAPPAVVPAAAPPKEPEPPTLAAVDESAPAASGQAPDPAASAAPSASASAAEPPKPSWNRPQGGDVYDHIPSRPQPKKKFPRAPQDWEPDKL